MENENWWCLTLEKLEERTMKDESTEENNKRKECYALALFFSNRRNEIQQEAGGNKLGKV